MKTIVRVFLILLAIPLGISGGTVIFFTALKLLTGKWNDILPSEWLILFLGVVFYLIWFGIQYAIQSSPKQKKEDNK